MAAWSSRSQRFVRSRQARRSGRALLVAAVAVGTFLVSSRLQRLPHVASVAPSSDERRSQLLWQASWQNLSRLSGGSSLLDSWSFCSVEGGSCNCTGTLVFSSMLGDTMREVNADGEVQCTAEALNAPERVDFRVCWCLTGVHWRDEVRTGLAAMIRRGLVPRIEIASSERAGCDAESDGLWHGCLVMSSHSDATVVPDSMLHQVPFEGQLDMVLRKLDECHRLAPSSSLRVLGVRRGQYTDTMRVPLRIARDCSVVYRPDEGAIWTAQPRKLYCIAQPGSCTATPCECQRTTDHKLELLTQQGRRCWACAQPGREHLFRINAPGLAAGEEGASSSRWPPSGIHCPPILWFFMDWRAVVRDCPVLSGCLLLLVVCLVPRRIEERIGESLPWTRIMPLFGPPLKRGEIWRFFTFSLFHVQFMDLFHNVLTLVDTLDVEGTPSIVLGDGSNLKCGVGGKQNFTCYPSIGIGSYHTFGVAILSSMIGGMCSTWITFKAVVTGASALGFGLSGAIVALYALYAGADLDQALNVQRSFQDWVWLRLIFVGFHIFMEWIRGLSQRDATGLFAHTAAFTAGFAYVLYFLPPMGDGSLLPADRPYVVPCTHNIREGEFATRLVPECVRLFSHVHEYSVERVRMNALALFLASLAFTAINAVILQRRVNSDEVMFFAGCEVSAVCCSSKAESREVDGFPEYYDGQDIVIWCQVAQITNLLIQGGTGRREASVEVQCMSADPTLISGFLLDAEVEASARSQHISQGHDTRLSFQDNVFLPCKFYRRSFLHFVLTLRTEAGSAPVAQASMPLPQALTSNSNGVSTHWLKLQAMNTSIANVSHASMHLIMRCLQGDELQRLRESVKRTIDHDRMMLLHLEQQVAQHLEAESVLSVADAEEQPEDYL